jgi:hypothetical protein
MAHKQPARWRRIFIVAACGPLALLTAVSPAPGVRSAWAGTVYVDGVSEQNLALCCGALSSSYFSRSFGASWIRDGHIRFARYFTPWTIMRESDRGQRESFEAWLRRASSLGLTPVVALTSYPGEPRPASAAEYGAELTKVLDTYRLPYLEPWNEPNGQGEERPAAAAHLFNEAYSLCAKEGCTAIAGDFQDGPGMGMTMARYETEYERQLDPKNPPNWGVHPYFALNNSRDSELAEFESRLPVGGGHDQIWFTEVGAYKCYYHGSQRVELGEAEQALRAQYLVDQLMPVLKPLHVFYYYFIPSVSGQPACTEHPYEADDALYVASANSAAPAVPRPAAAMIFDNKWLPWAYTEGGSRAAASSDRSSNATLTGSVYPGGFENDLLDTRYHFELGTNTSYGSYSAEGDAGSALGRKIASARVSGLRPGATYHYRLVAWNAEGTSYGGDYTLGSSAGSSGPAVEEPNTNMSAELLAPAARVLESWPNRLGESGAEYLPLLTQPLGYG